MKFSADNHQRRSIRLTGYDYSTAGFYFVTICIKEGECLLGEIIDNEMILNDAGSMVKNIWTELPQRFPEMVTDTFVVMPNHFHAIVILQPPTTPVGALLAAPPLCGVKKGAASGAPTAATVAATAGNKTLGDIMRAFKSLTAIRANKILNRSGQPFWQRNYYERIIRDENELHNIRQYIHTNPIQWQKDHENPTHNP